MLPPGLPLGYPGHSKHLSFIEFLLDLNLKPLFDWLINTYFHEKKKNQVYVHVTVFSLAIADADVKYKIKFIVTRGYDIFEQEGLPCPFSVCGQWPHGLSKFGSAHTAGPRVSVRKRPVVN